MRIFYLYDRYALTGGNYSGYPTFCAPDAIADALAENGIDMCLLANNHIYDGGAKDFNVLWKYWIRMASCIPACVRKLTIRSMW